MLFSVGLIFGRVFVVVVVVVFLFVVVFFFVGCHDIGP